MATLENRPNTAVLIVDVQNATPGLTGAYQVKSAIHVINAADHLIDFKLRANGLPPKEDK